MGGDWNLILLQIASGQTSSASMNVVSLAGGIEVPVNIAIQCPSTLPETVNFEVSLDGSAWAILRSGGDDVVMAAGRLHQIKGLQASLFRLTATGAVAADRDFFAAVSTA